MLNIEERADKIISLYVRISAADHAGFAPCYTCEMQVPWKQGDAGHFISRSFKATRWDLRNIRFQCVNCNRHRRGMQEAFEEALRTDLGEDEVDDLIKTSRSGEYPDVQSIVDKYRLILKEEYSIIK